MTGKPAVFQRESADVPRSNDDHTRRRVLRAGFAVAGSAATAAAVPWAGAVAQDKIAPAQLQYQATPKDGQRCDKCVNWEAPNACKLVAGTIAPSGWCIAFAPKES
jgi:hypothetical protein